ncbi:E3 ubiquitin-protein ligase RNF4-like [Wyeomyia smithii]|uniref:E3 ubiquitin-protein ligase RNF4-like n=1 Tax=Wyeomyia smithii TaxID=174621 RepID=UPI002467EB04|nr:E3 ubiquitin-protein ligase RNF4-like [Wyeomyia smithii]
MDMTAHNLDDSMVDIIERAETLLSAHSILNRNTSSTSNIFESSSENVSFETANNSSNHNTSSESGINQRSHEQREMLSDNDSSETVSYEVGVLQEPHNVPHLGDADDCIVVGSAPAIEIPVIDLCSTLNGEEASSLHNRRRRRRLASTAPIIESINLDDSITSTPPEFQNPKKDLDASSMQTTKRTKELDGSISEALPCSVNCPICFEPIFKKGASSTICGHLFCYSCITHEIKMRKKCPLCQRKLTQYRVHRIYF